MHRIAHCHFLKIPENDKSTLEWISRVSRAFRGGWNVFVHIVIDSCQPLPIHTNQALHFCAHSNTILKHSSEGDGVGKGEADQTRINSWRERRRDDTVKRIRDFEALPTHRQHSPPDKGMAEKDTAVTNSEEIRSILIPNHRLALR